MYFLFFIIVGYIRVDVVSGETQEWFAPLHTFCEEVVVVPKKINKKQDQEISNSDLNEIKSKIQENGINFKDKTRNEAEVEKEEEKEEEEGIEDEVWVLGSMFNAINGKGCVGIFDGKDMSKGE